MLPARRDSTAAAGIKIGRARLWPPPPPP